MLLGSQEEKWPQGMLLWNHFSFLILSCCGCFYCFTDSSAMLWKRCFLYFRQLFAGVLLQKVFFCKMLSTTRLATEVPHSLFYTFPSGVCPHRLQRFLFWSCPWYPLAESNIHLAGFTMVQSQQCLTVWSLSSWESFVLFCLLCFCSLCSEVN